MTFLNKELRISQIIPIGQQAIDEYTPDAGKEIHIDLFSGESAFTLSSFVKLIWKFEHSTETEEIIWSIKRSSRMPNDFIITDTDGIRKLALVCENNEAEDVPMCGLVKITERF